MLIILPMVALALALVLWGRDYNDYVASARVASGVAAIPLVDEVTAKAQSDATPLNGFHRGNAVTSTPLKDGSLKLCKEERYPVERFCVVLTVDRR